MDTMVVQLEIRCVIVGTESQWLVPEYKYSRPLRLENRIDLPFSSLLSFVRRSTLPVSRSSPTRGRGRLPPIHRGSCHSTGRFGINTFLSYHISTHRSISHVSPMWSHYRGDSFTSIRSHAKRIAFQINLKPYYCGKGISVLSEKSALDIYYPSKKLSF